MFIQCYNILFMEIIKTINQIGNSLGVIIPNDMLSSLGLKKKNKVRLCLEKDAILIVPAENREDRVMQAAAKYIKKYHSDFKKLAR